MRGGNFIQTFVSPKKNLSAENPQNRRKSTKIMEKNKILCNIRKFSKLTRKSSKVEKVLENSVKWVKKFTENPQDLKTDKNGNKISSSHVSPSVILPNLCIYLEYDFKIK